MLGKSFCLRVCKNYSAELREVLRMGGFSDISIKEYPQVCLNPAIAGEVLDAISANNDPSVEQIVLSEFCVLNNLSEAKAGVQGKEIKQGYPLHCLEMFTSRDLIKHYSRNGCFMITPGWLSAWQANLAEWGLDQESAQQFFREKAEKIVLLETLASPGNFARLAEFSRYIDRPYDVLPIGLDHFRLMVSNRIVDWRIKNREGLANQSLTLLQQQLANYVLAFDLLANLSQMITEDDAVLEIQNVFRMLFAPLELTYVSMAGGKVRKVYPETTQPEKIQQMARWAAASPEDHSAFDGIDGFILRITYKLETLGLIEIKQVAFPQYVQQYLNMGLVLAPLCGLSISNARAYQLIEENAAQLEKLASIDSLTGLYNRRRFYEEAEVEFKRSRRYKRPLCAIMIDIDYFKLVNDNYSHATGDLVLVELARVLSAELRESDIRARMGGEEFLAILPETEIKVAKVLAERLRKRIAEMAIQDGENLVRFTISLGVAALDENMASLDEFIHCSDLALFNAKRNGRNRVEIWKAAAAAERISEPGKMAPSQKKSRLIR